MTDESLPEILVRVTGPSYVSGVVLCRDAVVRAGDSMRWALGLTSDQLRAELRSRGCSATQRPAPPVFVLEAAPPDSHPQSS